MTAIDLATITLKGGSHAKAEDGVCLLEATALMAGEPLSDHPKCVSPVLGAFGRAWNDGMRSDAEREQLKQYIPLLIGTAGDIAADERRSWLAIDWLVRVATPTWLRLAGLTDHADKLTALHPITNTTYAEMARDAAWDARAAAGAARDAAQDAAGDATRAAAVATRAAQATQAAQAAQAVAWAAQAAWVAWVGAGTTAGDALELAALQASAHDLFMRMIRVEEEPQ